MSGRTLQRLSEDAEGTTISEEVKESSLPLDVADVYYTVLRDFLLCYFFFLLLVISTIRLIVAGNMRRIKVNDT